MKQPVTDLQAFIGTALYGASHGDLKPLCAWLENRKPKSKIKRKKKGKKNG